MSGQPARPDFTHLQMPAKPDPDQQPILVDVLTYAFRGSGKYIFILCVVLSLISELTWFVFPPVGIAASMFVFGYFCAIYFQFIQTTASGNSEAPEFPEISDVIGDILMPAVQVIGVLLISFLPVIVYPIAVGLDNWEPWISQALVWLGIFYAPMAILAVVALGSLKAAFPHIVLPAIYHSGWLYSLSVAMLCLLYVAASEVEKAFAGQLLTGTFINAIVGTYVLMANARLIGTIYREREDELDWA